MYPPQTTLCPSSASKSTARATASNFSAELARKGDTWNFTDQLTSASIDMILIAFDREHERKTEPEEDNEDEQQLEKADKFEHDRLGKMAAAERLAKMDGNLPKHDFHSNFRQKENISIDQPIRHTHNKSGAAAVGQQH